MRLRPQPGPFRMNLGKRGEIFAWNFLIQKGYKILEKNYRCKLGEVDVIAKKQGRLIFIEVKTRKSNHCGSPEEAVHAWKQKKIAQVAAWYLKSKKIYDPPIAFEVVAIDWIDGEEPRVRLIQEAFDIDGMR